MCSQPRLRPRLLLVAVEAGLCQGGAMRSPGDAALAPFDTAGSPWHARQVLCWRRQMVEAES